MKDNLEFVKERDLILDEIGGFDSEDVKKSGISIEEINNPTEETIKKLIDYVSLEYDQVTIYSKQK